MKKAILLAVLFLAATSLAIAKSTSPSAGVSLPNEQISVNYVDPGPTRCNYLDKDIVGQWRKHYVPNYRGWAEIACEVAVAVAGARAVKYIRASSPTTEAVKSAALKEEALEAAKVAATEFGCSLISAQSGWDLIRVWDGTYYRNVTEIRGHLHPAGYCYATRSTKTEYSP